MFKQRHEAKKRLGRRVQAKISSHTKALYQKGAFKFNELEGNVAGE